MTTYRFPFGQPVKPCRPAITGPRPVFILGAYPSALHVRWQPPEPFRPIKAMAVDNEPDIFWSGKDEVKRIERWKDAVSFSEEWGAVSPVGRLNGSSGDWVDRNVLAPLGITRQDAWLSDCLDVYHASKGQAKRLEDTYRQAASQFGLPAAQLPAHPSEAVIVRQAVQHHLPRLLDELAAARPQLVITLGNAALRVLAALSTKDHRLPRRLSASEETYGRPLPVTLSNGLTVRVVPLAHPGAPRAYKLIHANWTSDVAPAVRHDHSSSSSS